MSTHRDRYDDRPRERSRERERGVRDYDRYDRDTGGRGLGDGRGGERRRDRSRSPIRDYRDRERLRENERERETRGRDRDYSRVDESGRDRDHARLDPKPKGKKKAKEAEDALIPAAPVDMTADMTEQEIQMMLEMGIPFSFDTTQGQEVEDPNAKASGFKTSSKRSSRQYMNRRGGFNRPLPAEKTGHKVIRD